MSHCWTELDDDAFHHNLSLIKQRIGDARLLLVVKSNAYGHGLRRVVQSAYDAGVTSFAVTHVDEGLTVREIVPDAFILLLGVVSPVDVPLLHEHSLTPVTVSLDHAKALSSQAVKLGYTLSVHVKVDTGMGRLGIDVDNERGDIEQIIALPSLHVAAICSHLACADQPGDSYTAKQADAFKSLVNNVRNNHPDIEAHLSNSDGVNIQQGLHWDAVRCGLLAYGYTSGTGLDVTPCLSWKSRVLQVREIQTGCHVGYGASWRAENDCRIAVCDVGYADGYKRAEGMPGRVLINGLSCQLVGRVSMNYITVQLPDDGEVGFGDEVVLIGPDGDDEVTASELADRAHTITYEVLTSIRCSS